MKLNKLFLAGAMAATLFGACNKDDDDDSGMNDTDRNFMTNASYSNYNEIDAGTVAVARGSNPAVTSFGSMMQMDHTMAQNALDSIGDRRNMNLPTGPDQEHVMLKQMLMTLSGHTFDTAYMNSQVRDHQKTINLFQDEINNGRDQQVKNFASSKLPTIQHHYHMADSIARNL